MSAKSKRVVIRRTCRRLLVVGAVDVAGHPHAIGDEPVEVDVGLDQRPVAAESLRLGEDVAVLRDQRVAVPREIGGRLVRARAGVDVRGDGPGGMRRAQLLAIARLAHGHVAARRVRHHRGAGHRRVGARRDRHPEVLADLDRHREVVEVVGGEEEVGPERHRVVEQRDGVDRGLTSRAEVTLLVELAVVRQVALRDDAEHLPPVQHRGDVEQLVVDAQGQAHDQQGRQCRRRGAHVIQRLQRGFDQRLLVEEILVAVADQAQLGEHRQRHVPRRGPLGEVDRLLGVVPGIGEAKARDRGGDARESVRVTRVEARHRGRLDLPSRAAWTRRSSSRLVSPDDQHRRVSLPAPAAGAHARERVLLDGGPRRRAAGAAQHPVRRVALPAHSRSARTAIPPRSTSSRCRAAAPWWGTR